MLIAYTLELKFSGTQPLLPSARFMSAPLALLEQRGPIHAP
jgi:hypothetical protein